MAFITDNLGTILISLLLLVAVGFVIYKMISDKRNGKSSCGCNCASCPSSRMCHSQKKTKE